MTEPTVINYERESIVILRKDSHAPRTSWWAEARSRQEFDKLAQDRRGEMQRSFFGSLVGNGAPDGEGQP